MKTLRLFALICVVLAVADAFVAKPKSTSFVLSPIASQQRTNHQLYQSPLLIDSVDSSHVLISADTIDPTTALSDILGGAINSPVVLLFPVVVALSLASIVAWLLVGYANPADPDPDDE